MEDADERSTKARDKTASGLATAIKRVNIKGKLLDTLLVLAVWNNGYAAQRRKSNFGPNDPGKPPGVGLPTGGSEALEAVEHAAERETDDESGYPINRTICHLSDFKALKKNKAGDVETTYPHYLYLIDVDPDFVREIKEKKEIKKAEWIPFCEIIERLKLGKIAMKHCRADPEAFYYSHAKNFIVPFFYKVYNMTAEEIMAEQNQYYREWLVKFRPFIVKEIDDHVNEILYLKLIPNKHHDTVKIELPIKSPILLNV
ncbi:MAG: NUDIX domain-containing protein [bacterium]|nr:NUDIX domain-containing protein [bacterium]